MAVRVSRDDCIGCGICIDRCPRMCLSIGEDGRIVCDKLECVDCEACIDECPVGVFTKQ